MERLFITAHLPGQATHAFTVPVHPPAHASYICAPARPLPHAPARAHRQTRPLGSWSPVHCIHKKRGASCCVMWYNVRQQTRSPRNQTHSRQRSGTKRSPTSAMRGHSRDRNQSRCATAGDGVQSQCAAQRWKKIVDTNTSTNRGLCLPSEGTNGK